ncbi:MAG: radical SAM protein [Candidatus Gastranaerophilales bacterium]|nr:radical SAM protein [Candidatus Gastranaerophilales bacterium]
MKNTKRTATDALIAVTYNCNARCKMCNIWQETLKDDLTPADFANLPKTLRDINITGGEPFLRKDLVEIIEIITSANPKTRLVFSSNGFLTDKIVKDMKAISKINKKACIAISVDGIGKMHSEIRGVEDAYNKVLETISRLKKEGIKDIRIGYTASQDNIGHLVKVYNLCKALDIEFTMSIVHNSDNYFGIDTNLPPPVGRLEEQINYVVAGEYKSFNPRRLLRTYYLKGLAEYAKYHKRPLPCQALENSFFLDPKGDIYPCNMEIISVGNIKENSFEEI